jgi:hypothetical protein
MVWVPPHTFVDGTLASAVEVNENFQGVYDQGLADAATSRGVYAPAAVVTSLPVSPVDGQVAYLQPSGLAAKGVVWAMRYRAASASAYKWEFVGGCPDVYSWRGSDAGGSATPAAFGTFQPAVSFAGDWLVCAEAVGFFTPGSSAEVGEVLAGVTTATPTDIENTGDTAPNDIFRVSYNDANAGGDKVPANGSRTQVLTGLSSGALLTFWRKAAFGSITFRSLSFAITPVRLS